MTAPTPDVEAPMERVDLDALEALLTKATPGSWSAQPKGRGEFKSLKPGVWRVDLTKDANADLIVALVNAAPTLLALAREAAGLREALELISEGDVPRPVSTPWRNDGKPSKNDKCEHGAWMYEDCGDCIFDFARRALTPAEKETPND